MMYLVVLKPCIQVSNSAAKQIANYSLQCNFAEAVIILVANCSLRKKYVAQNEKTAWGEREPAAIY